MSNFNKAQQQRTASPNPAGQKESLSVAGCALVFSWLSKGVTDGAKVTVSNKNNALQKNKVRMSDESMNYGTASAEGFLGGNWGLIEAASSAKFLADVHSANGAMLTLGGGGGDSAKHFAQYSAQVISADLRVNNNDSQILCGRNSYVQSSSARLTSRPLKPLFSLACAEMEQLAISLIKFIYSESLEVPNSLISLNYGESPSLAEHESYSGSVEYHSAEFLAQHNHFGNRDGSTAGEIITNHNVLPCVAGGCAGAIKKSQVSPALCGVLLKDTQAAAWPIENSKRISSYGKITPFSPRSMMPDLISAVTSVCTALTSRPTREATSRKVNSPAPVIALSMSMRLGESALYSSSQLINVMKLPCADLSPLSAAIILRCVSSMEHTRIVTVFMILPPVLLDIGPEIGDQFCNAGERGFNFNVTDVLVIALTGFIVVADDADLINNVGQAILVYVITCPDWRLDFPDNELNKLIGASINFVTVDQLGGHRNVFRYSLLVVNTNNNIVCCQLVQQEGRAKVLRAGDDTTATKKGSTANAAPWYCPEQNQPSGASLGFLRWRRLISPNIVSGKKLPVLLSGVTGCLPGASCSFFIGQPFGSMPRRFSSCLANSLNQLLKVILSEPAAALSCSLSSGCMRIWKAGDCPPVFGVRSFTLDIVHTFSLNGDHKVCTLYHVYILKQTPPKGITSTRRGLTTNDRFCIEAARGSCSKTGVSCSRFLSLFLFKSCR